MANKRGEELTDEQWAIIAPLIPEPPRREDGRGRPWLDPRAMINGVLWLLCSGARWQVSIKQRARRATLALPQPGQVPH